VTTDLNKLATAIAKIDDPEIIAMILRAAVPDQIPLPKIEPRPQQPRTLSPEPRARARWSQQEIDEVRDLLAAGHSPAVIAEITGRTTKAIFHMRHRIEKGTARPTTDPEASGRIRPIPRSRNSHRPWTEVEIESLREFIALGKPHRQIGDIMGRTEEAITAARHRFLTAEAQS
jgi:hypothetical protein